MAKNNHSIGNAGEFYVLAQLAQRGYIAGKTDDGQTLIDVIATVLLLFMVQAQAILANPLAIVLIAIPLILQSYLIFWITAFWMRSAVQPRSIAAPGAMIGASNFFGLAVASLLRIAVGHSVLTVVGCSLCSVWCSVHGYPDHLEIHYPDNDFVIRITKSATLVRLVHVVNACAPGA